MTLHALRCSFPAVGWVSSADFYWQRGIDLGNVSTGSRRLGREQEKKLAMAGSTTYSRVNEREDTMRRKAFSLVELLVVIGIISVLMGMLLPAVQRVRGAAGRMACANNLRNLAMATNNYHCVYGTFQVMHVGDYFSHMFVATLPFLEENTIGKAWNFDDWPSNYGPSPSHASQPLQVFICPADRLPPSRSNRFNMIFEIDGEEVDVTCDFGMTSYGGNAGESSFMQFPNGVYRADEIMRMEDIRDGSSMTVLFGERNHYEPLIDQDLMWTKGFWAGPHCYDMLDITLYSQFPINYSSDYLWDRIAGFGSGHGGGANFAFVDGSTRFVSEKISQDTLNAMCSIAAGDVYSLD